MPIESHSCTDAMNGYLYRKLCKEICLFQTGHPKSWWQCCLENYLKEPFPLPCLGNRYHLIKIEKNPLKFVFHKFRCIFSATIAVPQHAPASSRQYCSKKKSAFIFWAQLKTYLSGSFADYFILLFVCPFYQSARLALITSRFPYSWKYSLSLKPTASKSSFLIYLYKHLDGGEKCYRNLGTDTFTKKYLQGINMHTVTQLVIVLYFFNRKLLKLSILSSFRQTFYILCQLIFFFILIIIESYHINLDGGLK